MSKKKEAQLPSKAETFRDLTGGDQFLQRITLLQKMSDGIGDVGKVGEYVFGMDKDNLGNEVEVIVGPWRPHALVLVDGEVEAEAFDSADPLFQQIKGEAVKTKSRMIEGRTAMYGVDFLFFVIELQQFGTFFFTKTARREASKVEPLQGRRALLTSSLVETKRYSWYTPKILAVPDGEDDVNADFQEVLALFDNPPTPKLGAGGDEGRER